MQMSKMKNSIYVSLLQLPLPKSPLNFALILLVQTLPGHCFFLILTTDKFYTHLSVIATNNAAMSSKNMHRFCIP